MGWTKRQFIDQAFEEIGLASYTFDLQPQQYQSALYRLDAMIQSWDSGLGIRLGYPIPGSPESSDLDAETFVPDIANEAIYTNLSLRLAPTFGRPVMPETKVAAKGSFDALIIRFGSLPEPMQYPSTLPLGAGWKSWAWQANRFFPEPGDDLAPDTGNVFDLGGT